MLDDLAVAAAAKMLATARHENWLAKESWRSAADDVRAEAAESQWGAAVCVCEMFKDDPTFTEAYRREMFALGKRSGFNIVE
jgi:hypothetical protein